jgi:hypothetical protein
MWYYGKNVRYVSANVSTKWCHAIMNGIPTHTGWLRIAPSSADGVSNVLEVLTAANANSRKVNVNIDSANQITATYMS